MSKTCPSCGETKSVTAFGRNRTLKDGLSFYCLECNRANSNRWYRNHRRALGKEVRDLSWVPEGFRWCPNCQQAVPVEEYTRNSASPTGFGGRCKRCHNKLAKDAYLLRTHGITRTELDYLRSTQNNSCAICGEPEPGHLDHDHETGKTRQLLCQRCNHGIGLLRDDPTILRAAADYVEFHRGKPRHSEASPSSGPMAPDRPGLPPVGSGRRRSRRLPPGACARVREQFAREADG